MFCFFTLCLFAVLFGFCFCDLLFLIFVFIFFCLLAWYCIVTYGFSIVTLCFKGLVVAFGLWFRWLVIKLVWFNLVVFIVWYIVYFVWLMVIVLCSTICLICLCLLWCLVRLMFAPFVMFFVWWYLLILDLWFASFWVLCLPLWFRLFAVVVIFMVLLVAILFGLLIWMFFVAVIYFDGFKGLSCLLIYSVYFMCFPLFEFWVLLVGFTGVLFLWWLGDLRYVWFGA